MIISGGPTERVAALTPILIGAQATAGSSHTMIEILPETAADAGLVVYASPSSWTIEITGELPDDVVSDLTSNWHAGRESGENADVLRIAAEGAASGDVAALVDWICTAGFHAATYGIATE